MQAPRFVLMNAKTALPLTDVADPALKNNHPNLGLKGDKLNIEWKDKYQNKSVPMVIKGRLCGVAFGFLRFPSAKHKATPVVPATTCTGTPPAKSRNPSLPSHPLGDQVQ